MPDKIPYRQIHLDFHTSELIDGVGASFDADEWVGTLKAARVNSINIFSKCHHGMFYYPSKCGPQHPGLHGRNLLAEQARVLKREGIRFCIYNTVCWSEDCAKTHPEWQQISPDGALGHRPPFQDHFCNWRHLCLNQPGYRQLLKDELAEQYELFKPNGYWIDIVFQYSCVCPHCMSEMKKQGLDPQNQYERYLYNKRGVLSFMREMQAFLKGLSPELEIYFNANPYETDMANKPELSSVEKRKYFDYVDIESLPSDGWGYSHFPIAANYINKYPKEIAMMNGKFHTLWGDFGSMRSLAALEYEAFRALSLGAKVCVGDQLHPSGKLDPVVYGRIGQVFASIEEKEPWLHGTRKVTDIAVLLVTPTMQWDYQTSTEGAYRVLSEAKIPFDYVNFQDDISKYRLLILPDYAELTDEMTAKINAFTKGGGKLLVTGRSGVVDGKFVLDAIPAVYQGTSEYIMRYARLGDLFADIPKIDHILYVQGEKVEAAPGARVLAQIVLPYFNRTYDKFCSHRQTPPVLDPSGEPAILQNDATIYISSPLFADYAQSGYAVHKLILIDCIKALYGRLPVEAELPNLSEVTIRENDQGYIVHTLSYAITRRCKLMDTVDDAIELVNKRYSVYTGFEPSAVEIVPAGEAIPFTYADGYVSYTILYQRGHSMVFIKR